MFNRSTRDLESATARTRFFGGRRADEIGGEMPILPVNAPGIPPPGPSLVRYAQTIGDEAPPPPTKGQKKKCVRSDGVYLTALVRSVLYQTGLPIGLDHLDKQISAEFVPGMICDGLGAPRYGPSPCRLVVVGKCLGPVEMEHRRPFCGPGSDPLWQAWREVGLPDLLKNASKLPTFLTNLVRFNPPPAAIARLPREWVADGLHLLYQELAVCRPEYVLVLGGDALKAVFGPGAKISEYKGRDVPLEIDCRPTPDSPEDKFVTRVIAAEHPAAVARDPDLHPALVASMRFLSRRLGFGRSDAAVATDYQVVLSTDELRAAVAESVKASAGGGYVAFDCEWEGRHPTEPGSYVYTVQWSHAPGHARAVFLRRCGGAENTSLPVDQAAPLLNRLLAEAPRRGARLVGHFAKSDLPWLHSIGVDLYPHYVGPRDDPGADGSPERQWAFQKCYYEGAFDTYVAVHAVDESQPKGLEVVTSSVLGLERYDQPVNDWKAAYCKENKIKKSELKGFGNCPESIIAPYIFRDADDSGRAYLHYNGDPRAGTLGQLDRDRYGNSCRQIFATRMRAWAAIAEMERYGMEADRETHRQRRDVVAARRKELLDRLRAEAAWPEFDPARRAHRIEFLFGEEFRPDGADPRPAGALSLYLEPYKATKTAGGGRLWAEAKARCGRDGTTPSPAADKETLISLSREHQLAALLLDIDTLGTAMKILFRLPDAVDPPGESGDEEFPSGAPESDPENEVHGRGFIACIHADGRVRTRIGHVETGRYSSSGPNLQNLGGAVDDKYDRILEWGEYAPEGSPQRSLHFISREILRAEPGWFIVNADLKGAEIAGAGWWSGDEVLMEHARRATLPESDPEYLDLHADLANSTFKLGLSLKEVKKKFKALRVAAKKTRFSHYYGASADTIFRQVLQETRDVTLEQIEQLIAGHDERYPGLTVFFASCRARVGREGWMCNGFGGMRRFRPSADRELAAAQQREGQNWTCQGIVADAIANALGNLWYEFHDRKLRSRIILTVHDSIMCECPPDEVELVADVLLEKAMCADNPIVPTTLAGVPLPRGPYRFGIDVTVERSWGREVPDSEWRRASA